MNSEEKQRGLERPVHVVRRVVARLTLAVVAVALAATTVVLASGPASRTAGTAGNPSAQGWVPAVPAPAGHFDLDGAAITGVDQTLYLSAAARAAQAQRPSRLLTFGLAGKQWQSLPALEIDRGSGFQAAHFEHTLCVGYAFSAVPRFACLRDRKWSNGPRLPARSSSGNRFTLSRLVATSDGLLAVLEEERNRRLTEGGAGVSGRIVPSLFRLANGHWRLVAPRQVDESTAGNTRANPLVVAGRPCLAYTALPMIAPGAASASPDVRVRCAKPDGWYDLGVPLESSGVDPEKLFIELDDAITENGDVLAGVLAHGETDSDWRVMRLHEGQWTAMPLAGTDPRALEQGTLYSTRRGPIAIKFAQPRTRSGVAAQLTAWSLVDDGGTATMLGRPLLPTRKIGAPLYYGITEANDEVFAMVTRPIFKRGKSDIRIYRLR